MFINPLQKKGPEFDDISFEIFDKNLSEVCGILKKRQFNNKQLYSIIAFRNVKDLNFPEINYEDYLSTFEENNIHAEHLEQVKDGIFVNKSEELDRTSFMNDKPMENNEENVIALQELTPWMYCVKAFKKLFTNADVKKYYVRDIKSPLTGYTNVLENIRSLISLDNEGMEEMPGINTSMHYVGTMGSYTPLHEEDGGLSSLNILKMGYKIWLVVDYSSRAKLENNVFKLFKEKNETECGQVLKYKLYSITPMLLDEWDIPYTIMRQNPGDLFFIRSGAYHAVINPTFSIAEAINFACIQANSSYEPYVRECNDSQKQNVYPDKTVVAIHTRVKTMFGCFKCNETFMTKKKMKMHINKFHNTQENHECQICNKQYKLKQHLVRHQKTHNSISNSTCKECKKSVKNLPEHVKRMHVNTKLCDFCKKSIAQRYYNIHVNSCLKNKDNIQTCEFCHKLFKSSRYLTQHKKKKHGVLVSK